MDRNADRAGLVGNGPSDCLANPPRRVGGELEAAPIVELLHRPHQAEVALLDEIQEGQPTVAVALGDRDDEAQVCLGEQVLCLLAFGDLALCRSSLDERTSTHRSHRLLSRTAMRFSASCIPRSMRFAQSTSSSADSSETRPISRRYAQHRVRSSRTPVVFESVAVAERSDRFSIGVNGSSSVITGSDA